MAVQDAIDELLAVDGVRDGQAHLLILHMRVAVTDGCAVCECRTQVEGEFVKAGVATGVRRDALLALQCAEDIRGESGSEVHLTLDEGLAECIGVVVDAEDKLIDGGTAVEVGVIGDHADELSGAALRHEEGTGSHECLTGLWLVGEGLHGLGVDTAPHVLGQDVDGEALHDG